MLKQQLEAEFATLDDSLNVLLERLRPAGRCILCDAAQGSQHVSTCEIWPFIVSRYVRSYVGPPEPPAEKPAAEHLPSGTQACEAVFPFSVADQSAIR